MEKSSVKTRRMRRLVLGAGLGVVIIGGAAWAMLPSGNGPKLSADPTDVTQVALGHQLYDENCAACHGRNLEGQPNWRQRLPSGAFPAPPHDETGHTWHHPDAQLFALTKLGVKAFAPADYVTDMPGFGDQLSDADIWAVLAYIKSRWPAEIQARQAARNPS